MGQALYPFMAGKLGGPAVLGLLYAAPSAGSLLATLTSGWIRRTHRHGLAVILAAAIVWGGVLCIAGTAALALALPKLVRYDGRGGLARKQEEDAAWAARADAVPASAPPSAGPLDGMSVSASTPDSV